MTTDKLGTPSYSSPRAALVDLRADLVQVIAQYEAAFADTVSPFASELIGPAIDALTSVVLKARPHLRTRKARHLVITANKIWASEGKYYRWRRKIVTPVTTNTGTSE